MTRAKRIVTGFIMLAALGSLGLLIQSSALPRTARAIGNVLFADAKSTEDIPTPDALIPAQGAVGIRVQTTEAGAPAFGPEEVWDYFASTDPPYWDSTAPRPQIENIEFLSALEVESRLGRSIDRPEGSRMCLVTIRGQFVPPLPPGVQAQGRPAPDTVMQLVFDGQTGNLLVFGFPPPER